MSEPPRPGGRVSLVVATIGRVEPLARLLGSLAAQEVPPYEVIVVDQNPEGVLDAALAEYAPLLPLRRVTSAPGLSRARNVGLREVRGDIVGFPDDDAWYPPEVIGSVTRLLATHPEWDGLTGSATGDHGTPLGRWDPRGGPVTARNVWTRGISFTIFLRRSTVERVGGFDESLGVGAGTPWGSGEETDHLLRALAAGAHIRYEPSVRVGHPSPRRRFDRDERARGAAFGRGFGGVLRRHRYPLPAVARHIARPALGAVRALALGRLDEAAYRFAIAAGRLRGWRNPPPERRYTRG